MGIYVYLKNPFQICSTNGLLGCLISLRVLLGQVAWGVSRDRFYIFYTKRLELVPISESNSLLFSGVQGKFQDCWTSVDSRQETT